MRFIVSLGVLLFFIIATISPLWAAETIISPLQDTEQKTIEVTKPIVSFAQLISPLSGPAVLGAEAPTPTPVTQPQKKSFTIAFLGDSMIDTLGPDLPHTQTKLKATYPGVTFRLLNFGVGGTNIDYGLERLTHDYTYLGNHIPSVVSQHPDIVVVESFGYNPYSFDIGALDKHWLTLARIVDVTKSQLPGAKIVIAATIGPNNTVFGDGAPGLSFDPIAKQQKTAVIKSYLENALRFAQSQHLPAIDVFHPSLDGNGNGKIEYINGGDHIHYSDAGRDLFATKLVESFITNHLLN